MFLKKLDDEVMSSYSDSCTGEKKMVRSIAGSKKLREDKYSLVSAKLVKRSMMPANNTEYILMRCLLYA